MASSPITSWQILIEGEKVEAVIDILFLAPESLWTETAATAAMKLKDTCSLKGKLWHRLHIQKQRQHLANKGLHSQSYGFSSSHVQMWKFDHKEDCVLKNWCFRTVTLEKTLKSALDSKEIKPVNPEGNQPWIFIGSTDAEAPIIWPHDAKSWLTGKAPDARKNWRQKEKGVVEDKMVR